MKFTYHMGVIIKKIKKKKKYMEEINFARYVNVSESENGKDV